jgi:hypothetical protein
MGPPQQGRAPDDLPQVQESVLGQASQEAEIVVKIKAEMGISLRN